jgi:hypothetical protein
MPTIAIYAAVALTLLVTGFAGGYRVESWHAQAQQKAAVEAAIAEYKDEAQQAAAASAALAQKTEQTHVVYQTITKTVDRIVERPVYRDRCFDDDGLRAANAALAGAAAALGRSNGTVPGADAVGRRDGSGGAAQAR